MTKVLPLFLLVGCVSQAPLKRPILELPPAPSIQGVEFQDTEGGLFLSYREYRKLEENIIEYRRYILDLEAQLGFYKEVGNE